MPDRTDALVSTSWLARHLGEPRVRVVDASWHLAASGRDAHAEYLERHIPGAVFFDLDTIGDHASNLPHMLPSAGQFAAAVGDLGIASSDQVVIYDATGVNLSAPRAWWMFRVMGHRKVAVLDGGLAGWLAEGGATESGEAHSEPTSYETSFDRRRVVSLDEMDAIVAEGTPPVVDARSPERFSGAAPEPRPGLRSGHHPGAHNVHFRSLVDDHGRLRPPAELRQRFVNAGVQPDAPIVTTCGSGVTACALVHALYLLGNDDVRVYDGSWAEWGREELRREIATSGT